MVVADQDGAPKIPKRTARPSSSREPVAGVLVDLQRRPPGDPSDTAPARNAPCPAGCGTSSRRRARRCRAAPGHRGVECHRRGPGRQAGQLRHGRVSDRLHLCRASANSSGCSTSARSGFGAAPRTTSITDQPTLGANAASQSAIRAANSGLLREDLHEHLVPAPTAPTADAAYAPTTTLPRTPMTPTPNLLNE